MLYCFSLCSHDCTAPLRALRAGLTSRSTSRSSFSGLIAKRPSRASAGIRAWTVRPSLDRSLFPFYFISAFFYLIGEKLPIPPTPYIAGTVAVSYASKASFDDRVEASARVPDSKPLVLLWSFSDPINPKVPCPPPSLNLFHSSSPPCPRGAYRTLTIRSASKPPTTCTALRSAPPTPTSLPVAA